MSISQQLQNAQQELQARRPLHSDPKPIGSIDPLAAMKAAAPDVTYESPETAVRSHVARLIEAGPVKLDSLDTSHPQVKHAVKMARLWAERKRGGYQDISLVLCGHNGAGKTHIAQAIWWSMCDRVVDVPESPMVYGKPMSGYAPRPSGRFYLSNDLLGLMGQSREPETGITLPTRAASVIGYPPLIVIDDIGLEQAIPFVGHGQQEEERHARMFKVVNHCQSNISVIVTTNKTWPELSTYIGKRAASRLLQMAPAVPGTGDSFIVDMFQVPDDRRRQGRKIMLIQCAFDHFLGDEKRKLITRKKYQYKLRPFLDRHGSLPLDQLTAAPILQWFAEMEPASAEATLAMIRACLVAFLNHCQAQGWLENNPAKSLPRYDGRPQRVITADPEHVAQALTVCGFLSKSNNPTHRRDAAIFTLAAISGGRRSNIMTMPFRETMEALAYPETDAAVGNIYTVATKGKTPIEIVFGQWHAGILRGWLEVRPVCEANRLFVHLRPVSLGRPLEANGLGHARKNICKIAGVPTITFQQLRKLKGTQIARQFGLELAASALGHISGTRVIREHYYNPDKHAAHVAILLTGKS